MSNREEMTNLSDKLEKLEAVVDINRQKRMKVDSQELPKGDSIEYLNIIDRLNHLQSQVYVHNDMR